MTGTPMLTEDKERVRDRYTPVYEKDGHFCIDRVDPSDGPVPAARCITKRSAEAVHSLFTR